MLLNSTNPAAPAGYVNAKPQTDGATPQQSITHYVPNVGGVAAKTASYLAVPGDNGTLVSFDSASAVTLTLPVTPPFAVWKIVVQNVGAGVLTVNPNGKNLDGAAGSLTLNQNSGLVVYTDGTNYFTERGVADPNALLGVIVAEVDGSGSTPATGFIGQVAVPFSGTITEWTMLSDASGSAQITVSKASYSGFPTFTSIVASAPPNLTSAQKNQSSTLTGWTTAVSAGDILKFNLDSASTVTWVGLYLQVTKV